MNDCIIVKEKILFHTHHWSLGVGLQIKKKGYACLPQHR